MRFIFILIVFLLLPTICPAAGDRVSARDYAVLKKAYDQLQAESFDDCLHTLSSLLGKKHPSSYALSYAALASGGLNQPDQAVNFLTRGTQVYPEKSNFWHNLGVYQMQGEKYSGAVKTFEKLISMEKESIPASYYYYYYHLSFALFNLEKYGEALEIIKNITRGHGVKKLHIQLQIHCLIALEKWKDCQDAVQRLIRLDPTGPHWDLLGRIAINRKKYNLGCAALEINNIQNKTAVPNRTVEHLYRAQSAWNEAARFQRKNNSICAQSLFRAGQYEKALLVLDQDAAQHMENSYLRGQLLFALGRHKEAVEALLEVENQTYLFLGGRAGKKKPGLKGIRRLKDKLLARTFLLAGQIYWMDRNWVAARDLFKKLELMPGQESMGQSLAACMQFYLDEAGADQELSKLYDPPLVMTQDD